MRVFVERLATGGVPPDAAVDTGSPACVRLPVKGSARRRADRTNPALWRLLDAYCALSGLPVLLNTSFNGADADRLPPDDAVSTFTRCGLDALVSESYIVQPRPQ